MALDGASQFCFGLGCTNAQNSHLSGCDIFRPLNSLCFSKPCCYASMSLGSGSSRQENGLLEAPFILEDSARSFLTVEKFAKIHIRILLCSAQVRFLDISHWKFVFNLRFSLGM